MKNFLQDFTSFLILIFIIWGLIFLAGEAIDDEVNRKCEQCHFNK